MTPGLVATAPSSDFVLRYPLFVISVAVESGS